MSENTEQKQGTIITKIKRAKQTANPNHTTKPKQDAYNYWKDWRQRERERKAAILRRKEEEEFRRKVAEDRKRLAEADPRTQAIVNDRKESADLLLYNHERGMSKKALQTIWGRTFVDAVLSGNK